MDFNIDLNNILYTDLHMHTSFSDGMNSPADMLRSAARKGIRTIGISDHSYTFFDESYCIPKEKVNDYLHELIVLKEKCRELEKGSRFAKALGCDSISFHAGIEQDYYSTCPTDPFDYVIGSVHYIRLPAGDTDIPDGCLKYDKHVYIPVDESPDILKNAAAAYYRGDIYSLIEDYFLVEADVTDHTGADIIGHFDLISKFNEDGCLFDPLNERYVNAWKEAACKLCRTGAWFEINTGAISRGYRTSPYPSDEMIRFIKSNGGKFILSSDAHNVSDIGKHFDKYKELL